MSTSKKQIIITICIALIAAAAILCTVIINGNKTETGTEENVTHLFSASDTELIKMIGKEVSIYVFRSEDSLENSSDTAEVSYRMLLNDMAALNSKITVNYVSGSEAERKMTELSAEDKLDCVFVCGSDKKTVKYGEMTKMHPVAGKIYAIDRSMLMQGLCSVCGVPYDGADDRIAVTVEYDKDGDTLGSNLRAFMFPSLERKDVKRIAVTNESDTYFAYKASNDSSFVFAYDAGNGIVGENGEPEVYTVNTSYDASMTSSLIVSSIYPLSTSKIYGASEGDYGLSDKSKATLIIEVFTSSNEYHVIVVGDKTPSGTGYFAKYYYLYAKGALGNENYVKLLKKADENDDIAKYTYAGKQFSGYGAEFYTKPFVYIIGTDIETAALHPLNDYLTGELVYTVSDQTALYTVDDIHVNFISRNEELVAKLLEEKDSDGVSMQYLWKIVAPEEYLTGKFASPSDAFFDMLNTLVTLRSDKIFEYKMKKDENGVSYFETDVLKKYGLDTPEVSFSYCYNDTKNKADTRTEAFISKKDENGSRYVYSYIYVKNDDGSEKQYTTGIIAKLDESAAAWADKKTVQFIEPNIFNMFIQYVDSVTVEFDGKKYEFVLLKDGESVNDVSCNGKKVDLQSVRYLYQTILGVKTVDVYAQSGGQLPEMLRLDIKTQKGEYDFRFFRISVKKALCTLNGKGNYYVNTDTLTRIQQDAETIASGGTIEKYE